MITKYFCDCGRELIFKKESETIFCQCGNKYNKGFCDECMSFSVDQMETWKNDPDLKKFNFESEPE